MTPFKENNIKRKNISSVDKKSIYILGDSMVKSIKGIELKRACTKDAIFVKCFPGAKIQCMRSYCWPSMKNNPSHVITCRY